MNDSFEEGDARHVDGSAAYMSLSSSEKGELIFKDIRNSYIFWQIKKALKDELIKPNSKYAKVFQTPSTGNATNEIQDAIPKLLKELNLETKIKNKVHEILDRNGYFQEQAVITSTKFSQCTNSVTQLPEYFYDSDAEPLEAVQTAHKQWCEHLKMKLNGFVRSQRKPWFSKRKAPAKPIKKTVIAAVLEQEDEVPPEGQSDTQSSAGQQAQKESPKMETYQITASGPQNLIDTASLYDARTFFEHVMRVTSTNFAGNHHLSWGQIRLHLKTRTLEELRKKFIELNVTMRQIGVDEEKSFVEERILIGERLLNKDYQPFLVQYAKRGVPPTLRCRVYKKILYAEITQKEMDYYIQQQDFNAKWDTALDDLILSDVQEICNDDKFFIFQEQLEANAMFFFRDRQVYEMLKARPNGSILAIGPAEKPAGLFPASSVLPVQHFTRYFAPFCYLSDQKEEFYFIFRAMYCKYFCHLQSLSSHEQGILSLCRLFEELLQTYEPEVCYHLNTLGVNPLKVAYGWIYYCFVNVLEVDQVFLIFDRILGFETLEVLPVLAAGIFSFRANLIVACQSQEEFDELFVDLSQIKITPILQHFLFAAGVN